MSNLSAAGVFVQAARVIKELESTMKRNHTGRSFLFAIAVVLAAACNSDPVSAPFSLEDEINANGPYASIVVTIGLVNTYYTAGVSGGDFDSAVAVDGLLVLTMANGDTEVFNLTTISSIDIEDDTLRLRY